MNTPTASAPPEHPAPQRQAVSLPLMWFGLLAAPAAWSLAELVSYFIASRLCRGKAQGTQSSLHLPGSGTLWIVLVLTLALALAGGYVALRNWRLTRGEKGGSGEHLLERGEGRSRFLAMFSVLTSGGFLVAFVFLVLNLTIAPLCGG